jgi:uncharacterized membrane protein
LIKDQLDLHRRNAVKDASIAIAHPEHTQIAVESGQLTDISGANRQEHHAESISPDTPVSNSRVARLAFLMLFFVLHAALITAISSVFVPPSVTIVLLMKVACIVIAVTALSYEESNHSFQTASRRIAPPQYWRSALYGIAALAWMTSMFVTSELFTL